METDKIIKRFDAVESTRSAVEQTWDEIERLVLPYRGKFFQTDNSETSVEWHKYHHLDSTAIEACDTLASSLQGSLTSPMTKWFTLAFRDKELNSDKDALEWLEACAKITYDTLQSTNFNTKVAETYLDVAGLGSAVLAEEQVNDELEPDEEPEIVFDAVPVKEAFFEMTADNKPKIFYRRLMWTASQIVDKFGIEEVPEVIRTAYEDDKNVDTRYKVIFCVYLNEDTAEADTSQYLVPEARPFHAKYIFHQTKEQMGEVYGYYEMPVQFVRWRTVSGSIWGHSQAHIALGDIKVANQLKQMILARTETEIEPPMKTTERGLIGDLNLKARGLNVVKDIGDLEEILSKGNLSAGQIELKELQAAIRRAFRVDQLELKESPAMTATEASIRYELMQRLLGPTLGRLKVDLLDPSIQNTFNMLYRAGMFPPVPESVLNSGSPMDIEYLGPLPRAQRMDEVQAMRRWIMDLGDLSAVKPDIMDVADTDTYARESAKLSGVPAEFTRDEAELKKMRKERLEEQMALEAAANVPQNVQNVAQGAPVQPPRPEEVAA